MKKYKCPLEKEQLPSLNRKGISFYENTNASSNNVLLRYMQGSDCISPIFIFQIADTYSKYNKTRISNYLNRMGLYFFN
jgi:hypothetical protein